jgi:hypothetical protein
MTNKQLIKKLENACVVCRDCGLKYGVYSVGCSSVWEGVCNVCDETKPITETRDYGYLVTGIRNLIKEDAERPEPKAGDTWVRDGEPTNLYLYDGEEWKEVNKEKIKQQSKEVAKHMLTQEPIMTDEDLDRVMKPSYLQGKIECWFTEDEIGFLNECLDVICENHESLCAGHNNEKPEDVALFESIEIKITELYQDHCVKCELSPAMKAYNAKYNTFGFDSELDTARWEGFRDAFTMSAEVAK